MPAFRRLISLGFSLAAVLSGCDDDTDPFEGYEVVSEGADPLNVVVMSDVTEADLQVSSARELKSPSGGDLVATATISPAVVPVEYSAYASGADEKVAVIVEIADEFVTQIDRVDVEVAVGSGETIDSIELERDALTPARFFAFLKPSCLTELRDDAGVCQLDSIVDCVVETEDQPIHRDGRCDAFSFRLWHGTSGEATPTEEATAAARIAPRWIKVGGAPEEAGGPGR